MAMPQYIKLKLNGEEYDLSKKPSIEELNNSRINTSPEIVYNYSQIVHMIEGDKNLLRYDACRAIVDLNKSMEQMKINKKISPTDKILNKYKQDIVLIAKSMRINVEYPLQ